MPSPREISVIKKIVLSVLVALGAVAPLPLASQASRIDISAPPFYNSEGPQVNVGRFSQELASADRESILQIVGAMEQELASLPVMTMYVAAVRLYDLGHRDEGVWWFYRAQYRDRLFRALVDDMGGMGGEEFLLVNAHGYFQASAGEHLNGYAGCDPDKWGAVLERLRAESSSIPDFAGIYPSVGFIPAKEWPSENATVAAGLGQFAEYMKANLSELRTLRAESNADAKFCGPPAN
jgi:hypothetical protein